MWFPPFLAQSAAAEAATPVDEVAVVAPELVREPAGRGSHGHPVHVVSTTRKVSYADLDLSKAKDQAEFRSRVKAAATAACSDLDANTQSNFHRARPSEQVCLKDATASGMQLADQVIAASSH
jgi:UrcA family protein